MTFSIFIVDIYQDDRTSFFLRMCWFVRVFFFIDTEMFFLFIFQNRQIIIKKKKPNNNSIIHHYILFRDHGLYYLIQRNCIYDQTNW